MSGGGGGGGTSGGDDDDDDDSLPTSSISRTRSGDVIGGGGGSSSSNDSSSGINQPIQQFGGTGGSFIDSATIEVAGTTLDAQLTGSDGKLNFNVTIRGSVAAGSNISRSGNPDTVDVIIEPEITAQFRDDLESQINQADRFLGLYPSTLPTNPRNVIPDEIDRRTSIPLPLKIDALIGSDVGESPVSASYTLPQNGRVQRFPVLKTPNTSFNVDNLPSVEFRVTVKPKNAFARFFNNTFQRPLAVTLEVSPSFFIEERTLDSISCTELYSDIDSRIDSLGQDVERLTSRSESRLQSLRDQENRILENMPNMRDIRSLGSTAPDTMDVSRIQNVKQQVEGITIDDIRPGDAEQKLSNLQSELGQIEYGNCRSEMEDRIQSHEERLSTVQDRINELQEKKDKFDRLEIPQVSINFGDIPCADEYYVIAGHLRDTQKKVGPRGSGAKYPLPPTPQDAKILIDQVQMTIDLAKEMIPSGSSCRNQMIGHMQDMRSRFQNMERFRPEIPIAECASEYDSVESQISELEQELGTGDRDRRIELPLNSDDVNNLRDRLSDRRSSIRDQINEDSPCFQHFMNRLDAADDKIGILQDRPGEGGGEQRPDLGCGDISNSVRNRVRSYEAAAEQYSAQRIIARTQERKQTLLDEANEIESVVRENVSDDNPCKQDLLNSLSDAHGNILGAGVRPESAVPCEDRFSEVGAMVETFEQDVIDLRPPVTPGEVQEFASRGNDIVDRIESDIPRDSGCRTEMVNRVRNLTNRVDRLTTQVRIQASQGESQKRRRNELLENLTASLNNLERTRQ